MIISSAHSTSNTLLSVFVFLMLLSILVLRYRKNADMLPNLVVTLGITGTFVGILIGLFNFDASNIQGSIYTLLEGLRVAFATSVVGLFLSILLRLIPRIGISRRAREKYASVGSTVDTLAELLAQIDNNQKIIFNKQYAQQEKIEQALVGEENSLSAKLEKLNNSVCSGQRELIDNFKAFSEDISENNAKALAEALDKVMRDFNSEINDRLGDNFGQLNESMGSILAWQESYRQQVDGMVSQIERTMSAIVVCEEALTAIAGKGAALLDVSEKIAPLLAGINESRDALEKQMSSFSDLAKGAREAFPLIEERLNALTVKFSETVEQSLENSSEMLERQKLHFEGINAKNTERVDAYESAVSDMQEKLKSTIDSMVATMGREIESIALKNTDILAKQLDALDRGMESELNKALETLGSQLTSLSSKFVEDYTPLTERLREVVTLSKHNLDV